MAKNLLWPFVVAFLSLSVSAEAQIGRTLDECRQSYGNGEYLPKTDAYMFYPLINSVRYFICAYLVDGKVSRIYYAADKRDGTTSKMHLEDAEYLLKNSAPEVVWSDSTHNAEETEMNWSGSVNGVVTYTAHLKGTGLLEIDDAATNAGGVLGAKRKIIDGQSYSVLPPEGSEYQPNQNVASTPAPTPAKLSIEAANADLARAWKSLSSQQRDRLSQEERNWTHHRDSLPAEERIKSTADRAKYIWSFVERTFDD